MITSYDEDYKATKQIMLGKATINPDFVPLASFIDVTFGVKTINIHYDTIDNDERPRLMICFEFSWESQIFNERKSMNYDKKKQKIIAGYFEETIDGRKYKTDGVLVCFSCFEPVAMEEANESISKEKIAQLKEELNDKALWEISVCFAKTTFFLYTDDQVKQYEKSEIKKLWANKYFDLLEEHNEFGYFKREEFDICLESKENFDNNYESNWHFYYM